MQLEHAEFWLHETEDGDWVATCPDLPTLCGDGETEQEAIDVLTAEICDYLRRVVRH